MSMHPITLRIPFCYMCGDHHEKIITCATHWGDKAVRLQKAREKTHAINLKRMEREAERHVNAMLNGSEE